MDYNEYDIEARKARVKARLDAANYLIRKVTIK